MARITFKIVGIPVSKGRPRFFLRAGFVKPYTPTETRRWEKIIFGQAVSYRPEYLWEGPIVMSLTFLMPRPKSLPKKVLHHIKKPDLDNLAKSVKDALQGIIYKTDSQVITLILRKKYAQDEPGVEVEMEEVET